MRRADDKCALCFFLGAAIAAALFLAMMVATGCAGGGPTAPDAPVKPTPTAIVASVQTACGTVLVTGDALPADPTLGVKIGVEDTWAMATSLRGSLPLSCDGLIVDWTTPASCPPGQTEGGGCYPPGPDRVLIIGTTNALRHEVGHWLAWRLNLPTDCMVLQNVSAKWQGHRPGYDINCKETT